MESPLKLAKRVDGTIGKGCLDRISSLPDELLGHILSSLSTRCAVSTSILSTRWRYLFTLTSCLSFDDASRFDGSEESMEIKEARQKRFEDFVYNVLESHQISPIKKFSLVYRGKYDDSDVDAWVSEAVQKGVQELHYQVILQMGVLPECLFSCETLVKLKIRFFRDPGMEFPSSVRLPKLKVLHLEIIIFYRYNSVETLLSGCELLEELILKSCHCDTDTGAVVSFRHLNVLIIEHSNFAKALLEIDAPNLAYLTFSCNYGVRIVPSWKDSGSLVKAELIFDQGLYRDSDNDYLPYDCELLKAASYKVTELHLLMDSVELLLTRVGHGQMPDFHNLARLEVAYIPYYAWRFVANLLEKSPQLETVVFAEGLNASPFEVASLLPNEALNPFSCHVKVIEVDYYCGTEF